MFFYPLPCMSGRGLGLATRFFGLIAEVKNIPRRGFSKQSNAYSPWDTMM